MPRQVRTLGGEGILSVRLEKVMAMLFLGSSAAYEKVNRAYGVMTAICRRYLHQHACRGAQLRSRCTFAVHTFSPLRAGAVPHM